MTPPGLAVPAGGGTTATTHNAGHLSGTPSLNEVLALNQPGGCPALWRGIHNSRLIGLFALAGSSTNHTGGRG
nr:MAG TPA_asm: hypothetical protein [Caudoviricetes sp.]